MRETAALIFAGSASKIPPIAMTRGTFASNFEHLHNLTFPGNRFADAGFCRSL